MLTFSALALLPSKSRNCGLCVYVVSRRAMLLVGACKKKKVGKLGAFFLTFWLKRDIQLYAIFLLGVMEVRQVTAVYTFFAQNPSILK